MPPGNQELHSQADASLDYNPLTYKDSVGDAVVRALTPGQYVLTHEQSGLVFYIDADSLKPLLQQCTTTTAKRSGRLHLHYKKKTTQGVTAPEVAPNPNPAKG